MAYCTPADVRKVLLPSSDGSQPPDSDLSHTAADLSDGELADAIAEADSTIDSFLGSRYAVPVAPVSGSVPLPIPFLSRALAAYFATLSYKGSQDVQPTDPVSLRYKAAMDRLNDIANGRANLDLPVSTGSAASVSVGVAVNPYEGDLWSPDDFSLGTSPNGDLQPWLWSPNWT